MITKHKFNTPHAGNNHLKLTRMKKILRLFLVGSLLLVSCQDDEEMKYASVYFPLATWADGNGIFQTKFDFSRDTTYIVGAYCSGSIMPEHDIRVTMELATDSLASAKQASAAIRAYDLLPESAYTVEPASLECTIRRGTERGDLLVTSHTSQLDADKKYILPLRIRSVSEYEIAPRYNTLFFGITKR